MTHGRHVKILGQASAERLRDAKGIEALLEGTIHQLGMRLLGEPHMYEVEEEIAKLGVEPFEDEGGVTGVAVLSTSHCAIHTWPLRQFFVMDVYSCRDFDPAELEPHYATKGAERAGASEAKKSQLTPADMRAAECARAPGRRPRRSHFHDRFAVVTRDHIGRSRYGSRDREPEELAFQYRL